MQCDALVPRAAAGLTQDFWEKQSAVGWGWQDVLPYFLKSEDDVRGASEFHGAGGPLRVSNQRYPRANVDRRLIAASKAAGIPRSHDYNNGPEQDGVAMFQVNQREGRAGVRGRLPASCAQAAEPRGDDADACVLRVEFEGDRAVGVRIASGRGRERSIRVEREVILSAGTVQSPQLLLLSGIGSADDLRAVGVDVRHDLRSRAQRSHPFVTLIWEVSDQDTLYGADKPKPLAEWVLRRTGPLTSSVAEVVAFVRTRAGLPAADVQFHMGATYYEDHGAETYDGHCAVIAPVLVSPQSRGRVWLRSADPTAAPRMITNSLSEPDDLRSLRRRHGACA